MMKRKLLPLLVLVFMLLFSTQAFAANPVNTIIVDGLTYKLMDDGTAMITHNPDQPASKLPSTVIIPEEVYGYTVTQVGECVFNSVSNIERIEFPDTVVSIGAYCFDDCTGLKSIRLPKNVNLYNNTFEDCTSLEELTIPAGTTYLDSGFCANCTSLKSVTFPEGLKGLGYGSFENCTQLSEINFPSTLVSIGSSSFENCSSLTDLVLPEGVTELHKAFWSCTSLKTVHIPASLTETFYQCFVGCSALETITVAEGNPKFHMQDDMLMTNEQELVLYPPAKVPEELTIPASVKSIGMYAFFGCPNLSKVTLNEDLESVENYAFLKCPKLTSITIPISVTKLGGYCFGYTLFDEKIPDFTVYGYPDSVAYKYAANNGFRFVSLDPDQDEPTPTYVPVSELTYTVKNGNAVITGAKSDICSYTALIIPETIDGYPVTEIAETAFFWNAPPTVIISDSVKKIGSNAFLNVSGLKSITFPKNVEFMGSSICATCHDLTEVVLPENLTTIPGSMFEGCSSLAEIEIPETVTKIEGSAFCDCTALTEVNLPESVTAIGECAFAGCTGMEELWLPAGVKEIGYRAFGYTQYGQPIDGQYLVLYPSAARLAIARNIPFALLPFSDDTEAGTWSWASDSIYNCVGAGVISGYPNNTFQADKSVSRIEFVIMLHGIFNLLDYDLTDFTYESHPFTDAQANWYRDALNWAYTFEIVSGTSSTTFSPNNPITRQEMATIVYRFLNTFFEITAPSDNLISGFEDAGQVASYARVPMEFCLENGILYGTSSTTLAPKATATRAQAAAVIYRTFLAE